MNKKKEALGKGIRALLQTIDTDELSSDTGQPLAGTGIARIPLNKIEVNPFQPRADFDEKALRELTQSIKTHGLIQPITVRKGEEGKYQLIAGERRLRACKIAGYDDIECYIRAANDQEMLEIGLIENIQREDLNAMEIAINYNRLIDECDLKQEELADRVGKERSTVTNYIRLLKLPPSIQNGIKEKKISMGHARALIGLENPDTQLALFKEIISKSLSVRQVEVLARGYKKTKKRSSNTSGQIELSPEHIKIQDDLRSFLGTKVKLKTKDGNKGEITIEFYNNNDLTRIIELIDKD